MTDELADLFASFVVVILTAMLAALLDTEAAHA